MRSPFVNVCLLRAANCAIAMAILWCSAVATSHAQDTVGHPLIDRPSHDTASGAIFVLDAALSPGQTVDWGFFDNNFAGRDITPLLLQPNGTSYDIVGIGTTQTSTAGGAQNSAFGLVSGSDATGLGTIFGWKDGSIGGNNQGVPEWTNAAPGRVVYFGGGHTSPAVGNSLAPALQLTRTYSIEATIGNLTGETVGNGLMNRASNDGANGAIFVLNDPFTMGATLTDWAFYDDDTAGRQMTPLLLTPSGANWEITGIGTTRTSDGSGAQSFAFDLLEGSGLVGADIYFGFKDGSDGSNNQGVADFDTLAGAANVIYLGAGNTSFDVGDTFGVAGTFDRSYSVQAITAVPELAVPEPASIAIWALIGLAASAYFWRRKRR